MGRHSKNASAVGKETMTYAERRRMGHGTQTMRLGKHSALPFAYCHLGLAPAASPVCTPEGVTYDKEAIIECLLAQREDNKRRKAAWDAEQAAEAGEDAAKAAAAHEARIAAFERQNLGAAAGPSDASSASSGEGGGGAAGAGGAHDKQLKAYWLPSMEPADRKRAAPPPSHTLCPTTRKRLRAKDLVEIKFMRVPDDGREGDKGKGRGGGGVGSNALYMDPLTRDPLTDKAQVVVLKPSGVAMLESSYKRFVEPDGSYEGRRVRPKDVIRLQKGGTGFAGGGASVEAKAHHMHGLGTATCPLRGTGAALSNFGLQM